MIFCDIVRIKNVVRLARFELTKSDFSTKLKEPY